MSNRQVTPLLEAKLAVGAKKQFKTRGRKSDGIPSCLPNCKLGGWQWVRVAILDLLSFDRAFAFSVVISRPVDSLRPSLGGIGFTGVFASLELEFCRWKDGEEASDGSC